MQANILHHQRLMLRLAALLLGMTAIAPLSFGQG